MSNIYSAMSFALASKLGVQTDDIVQHNPDSVFYNTYTSNEYLVLTPEAAHERAVQTVIDNARDTIERNMIDAWQYFDAKGYAEDTVATIGVGGVLASDGEEISLGFGFVAYRMDENGDFDAEDMV